jgi:xanthine dehydrogenase accessory factor
MLLLEQFSGLPSVALATVTSTVGSTPRKQGCSALFDPSGLLSGTIGGGVVENKVQQIVRQALSLKRSGYYSFTLDKDISDEEEAICGGQMSLLIDANPCLHNAVFGQIRQSLREGTPGVLVTRVSQSKDQPVQISRFWKTYPAGSDIRGGELSTSHESNTLIIQEPLLPPPRLLIAGAGHIGKALAHLASLLDFDVTVIDERPEYANRDYIPDADQLLVEAIGPAMQKLPKTSDTYIVIVTRGHKTDAEALRQCINSGAAYIGMIGSVKKIALMCAKFMEEKWATPAQWERIHAPIGLNIHSESVQEIAVSIAAELVFVRNRKIPAHA